MPLAFMASAWRIIFLEPPPDIIRIIFCIYRRSYRLIGYNSMLLRLHAGICVYNGKVGQRCRTAVSGRI